MGVAERASVAVSNIPQTATAKDLVTFLESKLGIDSVFAVEIFTERKNWKSRGYGRVQFSTLAAKSEAQMLSLQNTLVFGSRNLCVSETYDEIIVRPVYPRNRTENGVLRVGFMVREDCMSVLESWEDVRAWVMPERKRVDFWVCQNGDCCRLEVSFEEILEATGCCLDGEDLNVLLLKLKYVPKMYKRISGPNIVSKFRSDRYHFCKEEFDYLWVRTTDFSSGNSIGQSTSFCWEIGEGLPASEIFSSFQFYKEGKKDLTFEDGEEFKSRSDIVPLVSCGSSESLAYEVLYQLNSLVHTQKISLPAANSDLIGFLGNLSIDTALAILQKLHKLKSICYDPLSFLKMQFHLLRKNKKYLPAVSHNVMKCHRVLITPSKIYCLGPELETSNYVVKNFADYASDFMRVTFVEDDWGKLSPNAVSMGVHRGIFSKPYRTAIYYRILSVLRDGILIGSKRFEFLAFSASQLRSNSVWMFASNDKVKAEDVREWMGCFNQIRSVSKCAARMGQLFSSSFQTLLVQERDVEIIPDIEDSSDGIKYCFSDGIGKISMSFARQVAQACGLNHTPSAFQIRYGGYKGVIAIDRNSFRKLSLRNSMLKFDSKNRMLNVTRWSESMPCYLNREIITLFSTLGVKDEAFLALQNEQLRLLGRMLTEKEAALDVLMNLNAWNSDNLLIKMLLSGYEPNIEPYLSMMIQAHYWILLSDLKSRCRIFVPKGRILVGCLDETGILDYGQVYVRIMLTKTELERMNEDYFHKVDENSSIVVGKVVVTRNPCLHPGDVRVLEAVYDPTLEEKGLLDCLVVPSKGERPHPNECSGGDLDGDLFFVSWDQDLIPSKTVPPMDYTGRRPRIMDHDVSLEEIHKFFVDYMINDTLGAISTAHLVHADREEDKAMSSKCLELAGLHSMAVDFAKTGAPAEMPRVLKPKLYPDFMEREDKPMYTSTSALGKLYKATVDSTARQWTEPNTAWTEEMAKVAYDHDLEVVGYETFLDVAESHKDMYSESMNGLMTYYWAENEDEILTGNLRNRASFLQRDNRRYGDMKDRILVSVKSLQREARGWFESCSSENERMSLASAWYHVTYHSTYRGEETNFVSFPWIVGDVLLKIKASSKGRRD